MIGTPSTRKRNPVMSVLIPLFSLIVFAAVCFLLCEAVYLLNQQGISGT